MSDGKKYWGSLEELEQTEAFKDSLGKEFVSEFDRRDFLKLMGASIFMATMACSRKPVEKIIPYVNKPEDLTPGVANWYASTCGGCAASCGVLVKTREGRPIKLEGNEDHSLSRGGLCARGQASLLHLYDPDRLKGPVAVSRSEGTYEEIAWAKADESIRAELEKIKIGKGKVYLLSGVLTSPSTKKLIGEFLAPFQGTHVSYEAVVPEEIGLGQKLAYGQKVTPRYRFDQAKLVLSFGADFLGTWLSPVEFTKQFSKARRVEEGKMLRLVCVESVLSLTGTNADQYFSVKPGDELPVALALANELIVQKKQSRYALDGAIVAALTPYNVNKVAAATGVDAAALQKLAQELIRHRGEGLVLGGAIKGKNAVALQAVVSLLNSALENDGATIDAEVAPSHQADSSYADLLALIEDMNHGKVAALFIYQSNPIFQLPTALNFSAALKKVPFVVNFADRVDETALQSNFVCPDSHTLESWNDAMPQQGVMSLTQPTIAPLHQTRQWQDSLVVWGRLPTKNWYAYLKNQWQGNWETALQKGVVSLPLASGRAHAARNFSAAALQGLPKLVESTGETLLALYPAVGHLDGRDINNGWLQELPDPISKITWENVLSVAPALAKKMNLNEGDIVRVSSAMGVDTELPLHIQPKMNENTAMVAVGFGQPHAGKIGGGIGVNVYPYQQIGAELPEWTGQAVKLTKTGKTTRLAVTQGHNTMEGRPIIKETTFAEFQKNPAAGNEKMLELPSLWPVHEYKTYRWGMAIDMNSCTGCQACMIGCQSENNIPIVGKKQVINGREMHWIRIDRYYSGDENHPEVRYQPMLCQHCENAPCETVCPTLATFHDDEGLNQQVYNRCVGTRYCSNNCPYKVRRFNFFDYSKEFVEPLNLVLNPDITTRSRGVMEKCTFCIQRIAESKDKAKDIGKDVLVADGAIKTACQQSCPADAIVFGNTNDPNSKVSKLKKSPRGYHVLEDLNTKPQVTYLLKVTNT